MIRIPRHFELLPRKKDSNKRDYGHVLILAGSKTYKGAALLTARAAFAAGSGLVTIASPKNMQDLITSALPEAIFLGLAETRDGSISASNLPKILSAVKKRSVDVLAVGPGLSSNAQTAILVRKLIRATAVPVVLDADGLNYFKGKASLLRDHRAPLVLTPHYKEFERLFSRKVPAGQLARIALAKKVSRFYDVVLVLKQHRTLVAEREKVYVNSTGNPGMAKAGTGDVLTGILASFIGQGLEAFRAAMWAVYFHGKAGDCVAKRKGESGLLAGDLIDFLPRALQSKKK